jgi:putative peptidoglycan lipid II flippase
MPQPSPARLGVAALILAAGALMSRLLGFVREAVIAHQVGASHHTDAYNAAFTLPDMMNYFLAGGALSITFIPLFSAHLARGQAREGWYLFSTVVTLCGGLLLLAILCTSALAPWLVPLLSPGFDPPTLALTTSMTRIVLPAQLCFYVGGLIAATEMAQGRFTSAALAPLVYNGAIILCGLLLGPSLGMPAFAWGALIGAALGPLGLNLWSARRSIRFSPSFDWRLPSLHRFLWLSLPLMLGVSLVTVDEWIARYVGSGLAPGTISWFNYARRLMMAPIAILGQAAGQAALPFMSRLAAEGRRDDLGALLTQTLQPLLLLASVAAALTLTLAHPLSALIYERGAFSSIDTHHTASALRLFAIGILAWGIQTLASRAFYAEQRMWPPMIISTLTAAATLPLFSWFGHLYGAPGLALAATLGISAQAALTLWLYASQNLAVDLRAVSASLLRCALIAAGAGATAWLLLPLTSPLGPLLSLSLCAPAALCVSIALAAALRAPEWVALSHTLTARIRRLRRARTP